jgi:PAS domain S-box-containing protein
MLTGLSSLKFKVFGVVFGLTAALVCALVTYFPARQVAFVRASLVDKAAAYADLVSDQVQSAIAFDDRETAREVCDATLRDPDVRALALYESTGRLLYTVGQFDLDRIPPYRAVARGSVTVAPTYVRSVVPVIAKEGPTGTLFVELSTDRMTAETARIRAAAAGSGFLALAIGMAAAWAVSSSLSRRLRRLAGATRAVAAGDLSQRPVEDTSSDEVGQLGRSFDGMLSNINRLVSHIREAGEREKERLDVLVRERTSELEASVQRYRALVEGTNAVPWEMRSRELTYSYVSPQVTRLYGYEPEGLVDNDGIWEGVHPEDRERVKTACRELGRSTLPAEIELDYRATDAKGRGIHIRALVSTLGTDADPNALLRGISFDVTRQKALEIELRQAQKLESVGRLAAGVAHEINTPVQFVSDSVHFVRDAMTDLVGLIDKYGALRDAVVDHGPTERLVDEVAEAEESSDISYLRQNLPVALDRSLEGLGRVATIVRSMKEFAHPDQSEMTFADLNRAIKSTLTIARNEYQLVADVEMVLGELPPVLCYIGDLNQVVLNIVVNAAHAIQSVVSGTNRKGKITIRSAVEGDSVLVSIGDTGAGIPESVRDKIFDPFFTTKEVGKGTGQGLAIARSVVVDKHRGTLSFESEPGVGTTFLIRLPIDSRNRAPAAA